MYGKIVTWNQAKVWKKGSQEALEKESKRIARDQVGKQARKVARNYS